MVQQMPGISEPGIMTSNIAHRGIQKEWYDKSLKREKSMHTLKHAFRGRSAGMVSVDLHLGADHWFTLVVQDDRVGLSPDFNPKSTASLGMQLVDILSRLWGGVLNVSNEQGARFEIRFPEKF
jgi:glucose-6-phosphate-specific signal transduction histidine kinase